ncbi:PAS domain S-box-containing protein [Andreprevotia lacus DSM 23236]|jgi:PAS domain S-box-containing protein|uniref:Virulence sensor protein BvgS n=1 Tax=Andreprevotia lacus DSM 23236 TaxID=1121001 RepID=A0A1W1X8T8_9NEIS|nr:PAS domain S-box protein [Andreprevotia lacus]SMC20356.1 PAS domain S-box-containing protein [Andreprevotia lacus DSM 23236]
MQIQSHRQPAIYAALATLLIGLLISAGIAGLRMRSNEAEIQQAATEQAGVLLDQISQRLTVYQYGLRGARGAVISTGEQALTRETFARYSRTRDVELEFPGARGFGFIRRVAPDQVDAFLRAARADGMPDFAIRQLTPNSGERWVIQYVEPLAGNMQAVGLDIASNPERRAAAESAMFSGEPRLTAPITLVQAGGAPQQSFLLLLPIYRSGTVPATPAERNTALLGWSYAPLVMADSLKGLTGAGQRLHLSLRDITTGGSGIPFFDSAPQAPWVYPVRLEREFFGRRWQLDMGIGQAFIDDLRQTPPRDYLLVGALISLLASGLMGGLAAAQVRKRVIGEGQARLAAIVESSNDAIVGFTAQGEITSWNGGAQRLFGFTAEQVMGRRVAKLLVPPGRQAEEDDILQRVARGERVVPFETQRLRADGSLVDVSVTVSPVRDADGTVIGASKTLRDITQQKATAARILELNASLEAQVAQRTQELSEANLLLGNVLQAASEVSIIATDAEGVIRVFNSGAERLLQYRAQDIVGVVTPALIHDRDEVAARGADLSETYGEQIDGFRVFVYRPEREGAETREWTYIRRDGSRLPVLLSVTAMRNEQGEIVGYLGIAVDITERKATLERLETSLATTRAVLETAGNPIIAIDEVGRILSANPACQRVFGYSEAELEGQNVSMLMPEPLLSEHDGYLRHAALALRTGARPVGGFREANARRKDGSLFPMQISIGAMRVGQSYRYVGIVTDLTELQQQRESLLAARDQLLMAAEVAELGIWTWELDSNALDWNDRMYEFYDQPLSLRETGLSYLHWRDRVHPDDLPATEASLMAAVAGTGVYDPVFRVVRADGSVRHIQAGAQVERDAQGRALRVTGINRDITTQLEVETTLREAKEHADAASAAKSSFLANMSHEIRTPMNAVLGLLQLLQHTTLDARQQDYVTKTEVAARALLGLLNDILDFSKIDAGKLELDPHPFELDAMMRDLAVVLSGNVGAKDIELLFTIDPSLPGSLVGDRLRIQQVMINLAGNAIKFTQSGEVLVGLRRASSTAATVTLEISVRDTGIGIAPEQLSRIFDGFSQAEASTTRRFGGTGLGLAISRRLVELMGGRITVSSVPGKGSCFTFSLTLPLIESQAILSPSSLRDQPLRILIADDNPIAAQVMSETVRSFGWQADRVVDGDEACEAANAALQMGKPYDIVLMDWRMPVLDGLSAASRINQLQQGGRPPLIIMVTAYGREVLAGAQRNADAPFADFLTKPVTPNQLLETLERALNGSSRPQPAAPRPLRLEGMRLLVVEDNALNRQVAFELLSGEGAQVTLADGGLPGVACVIDGASEFDVVIMDVQMPDIDGLEATRRIRADKRFAALPILAMTANASKADRQACLDAGMSEHIGKPIDMQEVVPLLHRLTERQSAQAALAAAAAAAADSESARIDLRGTLARFGGNSKLYVQMLATFEGEYTRLLGELAKAVAADDATRAAATLHTLKGVATTLGAARLGQQCAAAEKRLRQPGEGDVLADLAGEQLQAALLAQGQADHALLQTALRSLGIGMPANVPGTLLGEEEWQQKLVELAHLLDSGNMRALDILKELQQRGGKDRLASMQPLIAEVESLDFRQAAQTLRKLMTELQGS